MENLFKFFVLMSVSAFVLAQNNCEPNKVEQCVEEMRKLYANEEGPIIVKSEKELQTLCGHQQRALSCINNFVEACLSDMHRSLYTNLTQGVHDFISDFCMDNSMTRKIYLKHLSCFNKVADKVHHCSLRLNEWQKSLKHTEVKDRNAHIQETCCHFGYAMTCMKTVVQDGCPDEAHELFSNMVNKITHEFIRVAQCNPQSLQAAQCSSASWSQLSLGLFFASLILALSRRS